MKKRLIGIDVARALAVFGMIIVNFKVVFGDAGNTELKNLAQLFDGKAAATFVVLAGVGLALMTNSAYKNSDREKLKLSKSRIVKRALFLFVVGLSYIWIWPADILHFYGIYMLFTLMFINRVPKQTLIASIIIIFLFPFLLLLFNYETGWNFETLAYAHFWSIDGFFRNLFYNGFHPVIPWAAFMLFGLWFGRQNLYNSQFVKKALWVGSLVFIGVQAFSFFIIKVLSQGDTQVSEDLTALLGTNPMPPMPIYMINGIAISVVVISACILLANRFENNKITKALHKTGQLALSFYVAHVVIGMGLIETLIDKPLGTYSITFSLFYALIFSGCCILFAVIWLRFKTQGPLEWVMRKMTD